MVSCLACDLIDGTVELPGELISRSSGWVVEHCVGPLGVGTLVLKPERHVVHVADLTDDETAAMGPLIREAARVVTELLEPDQVYVTLWSHAERRPGHIHYVIQPVSQETMQMRNAHGPKLQTLMFEDGELPTRGEVERFAKRARAAWSH